MLNLNIPKMGYFLLVKHDKGWMGDEIVKKQLQAGFRPEDAQYTHIEVLGGGPWSVRVAPPTTKVVNFPELYKGRHICIIRYKNPDYEGRRGAKVAFWAATHCNLAYDWLGVIRLKIGLIWHWKNRYFCSENAAWALCKEYPLAFNSLKPEDIMPAHFLAFDKFEQIWEGDL